MGIYVEKITWKRAFFQIHYRADSDHRPLCLYRVRSERFVQSSVEFKDGLYTATFNITESGNRGPLDAGEWRICQYIKPDEANITWAERNMPYLITLARKRLWSRLPREVSKEYRKHQRAMYGVVEKSGVYYPTYETYPFTYEEINDEIALHPFATHDIEYAPEVLDNLGDLSRVFRYTGGKFVCTTGVFPRTDVTEWNYLVLLVEYYERNTNPRVRKRSLRFREKQIFAAFYDKAYKAIKRKGKRVLFLKENGEEPTENMMAVRDRMIERGLDEEFKIVERYRNTFKKRQNLKDWLSDIVEIARADYIFIDDYCPVFNFINPREETVLTQIWHAGVGFKSVGYARFGQKGSPDPYQSAHRRYTYALVGNEHLRDIYSEVFGIEKEALLATGMPRLDSFYDESTGEQARADLYERYPWMKEGRVIVFAPTFRGAGQRTANYPYNKFIDYKALYEMCERTNSYFVFEMHHFIKRLPAIPPEYADRLFDLTEESLDELYYVADVLVTDYSSCFYDFLLLEKPVVFYVPDKTKYTMVRGVQHTVDDMAPGAICNTFEEFIDVLENESYETVEPNPAMLDRHLENSGLACDRVIDTILLGKDVPGVKLAPREDTIVHAPRKGTGNSEESDDEEIEEVED